MAVTLCTPFCRRFGIEVPVVLAGMASASQVVSSVELAATVSNAGGLGVLGGGPLRPDLLREEIRRLRALTPNPFGVDLLLPAGLPEQGGADAPIAPLPEAHRAFVGRLRAEMGIPEFNDPRPVRTSALVRDQLAVVLEERVPVLACALGAPEWAVHAAHARGTLVIGIVGNVRAARKVRDAGVDAIVAQGHEAGGNTGRIGTLALVPQVVDAVAPVPVLAAGGIGDGRGLAAALVLGAQAVWVGTAFLVAEECPVAPGWKGLILDMGEEETVVSRCWSGKTARFLRNEWVRRWGESSVAPLEMPYQDVLVGGVKEAGVHTGDIRYMCMPTGQVGGMIRAVRPGAEIVAEIVQQARRLLGES